MNADKASRVDGTLGTWKREVCAHQRVVGEHVNEQGEKTGRVVCRECGEVINEQVGA
ncbi:hypothetical protein [uncultured Nitrospira sp.]|uniref:hypothetical protein n=1 Tax=uncultured Nitrospira sp. TaxID=157176 RepID=UPI0031409243